MEIVNDLKPAEGQIKEFYFDGHQIRIIEILGDPWWVLVDVCLVLELSNPTAVSQRLDADERAKFNLGRQGKATIINESGLYNLILRSDKPRAKDFRRWTTREVLPSIRKNGAYIHGQEADPPEVVVAKALIAANKIIKEREANIASLKPKAEYFDHCLQSESLLNATQIAKGYGWGAQTLNALLEELNVQYKTNGTWYLTYRYDNEGYTQTKTHIVADSGRTVEHTYWTQKGKHFLYDLLKKHGYLPLNERTELA